MAKPLGGMPKNLPLGKAVAANVTRAMTTSGRLICADNTGAKLIEIIAVKGYKGVRNRMPTAILTMTTKAPKSGSRSNRKPISSMTTAIGPKPFLKLPISANLRCV